MDYAIRYGKPREEVMRLIIDGGFDMKRWRSTLLENYSDTVDNIIASLSPSTPPRTTVDSPAAPAVPVVVDWRAVGPYPSRTAAEAARVLAKPGADTTVDDHFWDGINRLEPQRLALAIQAGAMGARRTQRTTTHR